MTKPEDQLKTALAENGLMDPEKTKRLTEEAVSWFDTRLKWLARSTFATLLIVAVAIEVGAIGFVLSFGTKWLLGFAILIMWALGLAMLSRLEYVVMSTKVGVLKEIKLLRLENVGRPSISPVPQGEAANSPRAFSASVWRVLSPMENIVWLLAVTAVVVAAIVLSTIWLTPQTTLAVESHARLSRDGAGTQVTKVWYRIYGFSPMTSSSLYTGGRATLTRWIDSRGRDLPIHTSTVGKSKRYTVQLLEPVMPGEEFSSTTTVEIPKMAEREGDVWTCRTDPVYGYESNNYLNTVQLPEDAEIVSVDPVPDQQLVQDGLPTLRFQATRGRNEKFVCTIRYRLSQD